VGSFHLAEAGQGRGLHVSTAGCAGTLGRDREWQDRNYQAIVPSTWNAGPRDPSGQPGAYEAALQDNHTLYDTKAPVEILRTIHSFDPCIACAVHVTDPDGEELINVRVR
jgi:Ni,Fe-hydrogenase I large subunit